MVAAAHIILSVFAAVVVFMIETVEVHLKDDDISLICVLFLNLFCPMKQKCTEYK